MHMETGSSVTLERLTFRRPEVEIGGSSAHACVSQQCWVKAKQLPPRFVQKLGIQRAKSSSRGPAKRNTICRST